jgi:RND family efflux transporter MFP subunit
VSPKNSTLDQLRIDRSEVDAERPRRALWVAAGLLLTLAAVIGWWATRPSVVEVRMASVRERRLDAGGGGTVLNASGYVTARRQATVSSKVTGKVTEVLIEEGMEVEEGQVLARLDVTNVRAGLELADAQLGAARSSVRETEVRRDEADVELQRQEKLVTAKIASQEELDRARAERDALAARLDRQREEVAVAERQLAVWRREMEDRTIRAPFTGVVVAKNAQPGEMISPISAGGGFTRTGIGTVVDMSSLEIEVDVNEAYINRVRADQPVTATLDAYPDWQIPCHVIAVIPTADRQKATVAVRIGFAELDPRILPDMGVKVEFRDRVAEGGEQPAALLVPSGAVLARQGKDVVLRVNAGVVERRAVRVGAQFGDDLQVLAGLTAGERVVVEGGDALEDGARVKESES